MSFSSVANLCCDQHKTWAHQICCTTCAVNLRAWLRCIWKVMTLPIVMMWQEQRDDVSDSYFWLINISGFSEKKKNTLIVLSNESSAAWWQSDSTVATRDIKEANEDTMKRKPKIKRDSDPDFESSACSEPHFKRQFYLNALVKDLALSNIKVEFKAIKKECAVTRYKNVNFLQLPIRFDKFLWSGWQYVFLNWHWWVSL